MISGEKTMKASTWWLATVTALILSTAPDAEAQVSSDTVVVRVETRQQPATAPCSSKVSRRDR